ncbi:unnamed protein product [Aphanomyces euteiches]|nr:hypothetical protein AeRB84_012731 [Aphanomyces euteiches]
MRVLLPLVFAAAFAWHPERHDAPTLRVVDARRILKGKFERRRVHYGKKAGEIIGYAVGNGLGTLTSAALGTVTGGNIGTRAGRSGLAAGRQIDEFTKGGKQAQAAAANKAKRTPVEQPPKVPILHTGMGYKKLDRTASSPSTMQRAANRATTAQRRTKL